MKRKIKYLGILTLFIFILTGCIEQTRSIFFMSNGGSSVDTINEKVNTPITKPSDPVKEGHTFDGWYSNKRFTSSYTFDVMPEENVTLYAKWIINSYTITFESNGGSLIDPLTLEYDKVISLPNPTKEELTFVGWFSDVDLTKYYNSNHIPAKNMTLYAKWTTDAIIKDKETYRVEVEETIQDAIDAYFGEPDMFNLLPSTGDVNILVIPIQFPNDKFMLSELNRINYGFFGDGSRYETLKSYYQESSYGALNISGTVLSPYTAANNYSYYENYYSRNNEDSYGVDVLIEELMAYYLDNNPNLDLSPFDSEGDHYIDGVHLVYSAPIDYVQEDPIYWAYQYYYMPTSGTENEDYHYWGDYGIDSYVFSGVDFLNEYNTENAWTIIHETGHLFGLEDYYDYTVDSDNNKGGLGGIDMMDNTIGDHNPFSKLLLDWIDPIVVSDTTTIKIDKYETSGDAIIVASEFDSIFDEYFILNYYTPTGLNEENTYLNESGLIMYDVKSYLPTDYENLSEFSYYFLNNNSDSINKLISIVEADGKNDISKYNNLATNSDLLQEGDSFILKSNYRSVCSIKVDEQTEDSITLTFTFFE
ncbi:MAG: hypothetical protein K0Q49_1811 [Haloplasmataceae bacterium]|nr:hypothetical protein [Haloplasmataceae bacterium]